MKTTINYTLPSGKTAIITVQATKFRGQIYAATSATVEGVGSPILGGRRKPIGLPDWAVSSIGKLPLTAEVDAQVQVAEEAINAAYADHNAAFAVHINELDKTSEHSAMIANRMAH